MVFFVVHILILFGWQIFDRWAETGSWPKRAAFLGDMDIPEDTLRGEPGRQRKYGFS